MYPTELKRTLRTLFTIVACAVFFAGVALVWTIDGNSDFLAFISTESFILPAIAVLLVVLFLSNVLASSVNNRFNSQNEKILYRALHDELTALPNRNNLNGRIDRLLERNKSSDRLVALMVLGFNRFREINETLGRACGDSLLVEAGYRLRKLEGLGRVVFRYGGDKFAILVHADSVSEVCSIAEHAAQLLADTYVVDDMQIHLNAGIGVSYSPDHGRERNDLIKNAEIAMFHSKDSKSEYTVYDSDIDPYNVKRLSLLGDLKEAIKDEQLCLKYQPKLNLKTNNIDSVEALVVWNHPEFGTVSPDDFIGLAEQSGLIKPLTHWVIKRAVKDLKELESAGFRLSAAVNVSVHNLYEDDFLESIDSLLKARSLDRKFLELEITETVMMKNMDSIQKRLGELNSFGLTLTIDDFGTGFSSLGYMKSLPVKNIKIDKLFVKDMDSDESDYIMVKAIIDLSHDLNFSVTAEGAEKDKTVRNLRALGCDYVQGFEISKPLTVEDLIDFLGNEPYHKSA